MRKEVEKADGGSENNEQRNKRGLRKIDLDLSVLLRRDRAWQDAECTRTQHRNAHCKKNHREHYTELCSEHRRGPIRKGCTHVICCFAAWPVQVPVLEA
jgi:hypothetical protein